MEKISELCGRAIFKKNWVDTAQSRLSQPDFHSDPRSTSASSESLFAIFQKALRTHILPMSANESIRYGIQNILMIVSNNYIVGR